MNGIIYHKNDDFLSIKCLSDYAVKVFVEPNSLKYLPNCQISDNPWKLHTAKVVKHQILFILKTKIYN